MGFEIGERLYRYDNYHGEPFLKEYTIRDNTPKGVWIECCSIGHHNNQRKWVSKTGKKRFAYPTKDQAFLSYICRKKLYKEHCERRLNNSIKQLYEAKKFCKEKFPNVYSNFYPNCGTEKII